MTADAQGSPDVALASDTAETGVDSAGRTAPTTLVAGPATTLGGAAEYIGLAHDGTNLYVGLRGTTDLTLQTVGSGGVLTPFACAGPTADLDVTLRDDLGNSWGPFAISGPVVP